MLHADWQLPSISVAFIWVTAAPAKTNTLA